MKTLTYHLFLLMLLISCKTAKKHQSGPTKDATSIAIAFPGAEGFGKFATGGRGGKVYLVNNLNDDGIGSLRWAAEANEPRIVVFNLSGTIHLEKPLNIKGDVTIAGQTAPGDGICIADYPVRIAGNNIVIRYMRFRMGDKNQKGGMVDGNGGDDAFGGVRKNNIIIDHCSMSWSTDEVCSVYAGDSTTLQWNIFSEPMNYSYHFETGDKDYEHHGYGGILGGKHISIHHNLYAHCTSRTPRFDGNRNLGSAMELADFRNNVIYNWVSNNVYGGEGGTYNIVNNYYKYGPATNKNVMYRVANPYRKLPALSFGKFYVDGNYVDGSNEVTNNNWLGVLMEGGTQADALTAKLSTAVPTEKIAAEDAKKAYSSVLMHAGASYARDTLDVRLIRNVKDRTGSIIDVQGGYPHGTAYEKTILAWPALKSTKPLVDSDADGMPDMFETKNGLDPHTSNANKKDLHTVYTNIEVYINSLIK